jgi:hypothetical protein
MGNAWVHGCQPGTPDIVVSIKHPMGARLLFLEVKMPGKKLRYEQKKFFERMAGIVGVYCEVIDDPLKLSAIIKKVKEDEYK